MSGIEAVEINLSKTAENKDFRIDSTFYTTKLKRNNTLKYEKIGNCLRNSQYGVSVSMNEEGNGYPIYRMNEIHNMMCDVAVDKYAKMSDIDFEMFKLNIGDVLFNRTNSYDFVGRTGVYYHNKDQTPMAFASYLVRLVPISEQINSEYLTAFLSCKYGITEISRRARQSINQTNVNPEEVKEILIPLLNSDLQHKIKECFLKAHNLRLQANKAYTAAETLLLSSLGLSTCSFSTDSVTVKSFSESFCKSGRLDAEYYQQKYSDIEVALNTQYTVKSLCIVDDGEFTPQKGSYKYIELADVGVSGNILSYTLAPLNELPSRARRIVKSGQLIVSSIEGSLSSCALITGEYDGALCSTGFYIISSDVINAETLLILFKSAPIQELMKKRCSGTIDFLRNYVFCS